MRTFHELRTGIRVILGDCFDESYQRAECRHLVRVDLPNTRQQLAHPFLAPSDDSAACHLESSVVFGNVLFSGVETKGYRFPTFGLQLSEEFSGVLELCNDW